MTAVVTPMRADRHGTRSTYVGGCRCGDCRAANTAYERRRARRRRGLGVSPLAVVGPVAAGVAETLAALDGPPAGAGMRALAAALAGELDAVLASPEHSPTHSAAVAAQLRQVLAGLVADSGPGVDVSWFFTDVG
jgi:hypothetical protein